MSYVDGFVLVVPKDRLEDYRAMAEKAGAVWKEYGALDYKECVADDTAIPEGMPGISFNKLANASDNELIVFSYIVYESREKRDEINAKVMADERLKDSCDPNNMPFDCSRMSWGGFKAIVEA